MKQSDIKFYRLGIVTAVLFAVSLTVKIISTNTTFIEQYYSTVFYSKIAVVLRTLCGWIPFSVGDLLYACIIVYCLVKLGQWVRSAFQRKLTPRKHVFYLVKIIRTGLAVYMIFNLLWGLNYNRAGITSQLRLAPESYSTEALKSLTADLVKRVNSASSTANRQLFNLQSNESLFTNAIESYRRTSYRYAFLRYAKPSIKAALFNSIDNYVGVAGYYNPFTGEAQINTSIPRTLLPFIIHHEIAHQVGYAGEDEANFVAYLVSKESNENMCQYSAYFSLFHYANNQLAVGDSLAASANIKALDSLAQEDEKIYRKILNSDRRSGHQYSTIFYDSYLRWNDQGKGMDGYGDVISLLIAYQKRYGDL